MDTGEKRWCVIAWILVIITTLYLGAHLLQAHTRAKAAPTNPTILITRPGYVPKTTCAQLPTVATTAKPTVMTTTRPAQITSTSTATTTPTHSNYEDAISWYSDRRVYATNKITTHAGGEKLDIEFYAKLLHLETDHSKMSWEGMVYTASAILNFCDTYKISVWTAGHDVNSFAVAPYVDQAEPNDYTYEVIDYVLSGGRIEGINHFRTRHYHTFGTPICKVGAHYFSTN